MVPSMFINISFNLIADNEEQCKKASVIRLTFKYYIQCMNLPITITSALNYTEINTSQLTSMYISELHKVRTKTKRK